MSRGQIVEGDVNLEIGRHVGVDALDENAALDSAVPTTPTTVDPSRRDVRGSAEPLRKCCAAGDLPTHGSPELVIGCLRNEVLPAWPALHRQRVEGSASGRRQDDRVAFRMDVDRVAPDRESGDIYLADEVGDMRINQDFPPWECPREYRASREYFASDLTQSTPVDRKRSHRGAAARPCAVESPL